MGPNGERLCIDCGQPNDPEHPNSPRCRTHRRAQRRQSEARSRQRSRQVDELLASANPHQHRISANNYAGPRGLVLSPDRYVEVQEAYGQLLSGLTQARRNLDVRDPDDTRHLRFIRSTLSELIQQIEDFNEAVRPHIYPPRTQDGD